MYASPTTLSPVGAAGGVSTTVAANDRVVAAPSSSVTVNATVNVPSVAYVWLALATPLPSASVSDASAAGVPSPQATVAACVSARPASPNKAETYASSPRLNVRDGSVVASNAGATLATITSTDPVVPAPPRVAVTCTR
jgi:hypothetical protein